MTDSITIPRRRRGQRLARHSAGVELASSEAGSGSGGQYPKATSVQAATAPAEEVAGYAGGCAMYDTSSPSASCGASSSYGTTPSSLGGPSSLEDSPAMPSSMKLAERQRKGKGKARVSFDALENEGTTEKRTRTDGTRWERRASWLSDSISRSEHTVIDVGDPNGIPRLITCVKASQGWDWNQDIFLPSYMAERDRSHSGDLERRQDLVEDIVLTDEEIEGMFPS